MKKYISSIIILFAASIVLVACSDGDNSDNKGMNENHDNNKESEINSSDDNNKNNEEENNNDSSSNNENNNETSKENSDPEENADNDSSTTNENDILAEYSAEEIEYARVWLEVIDNKDIDTLNVWHHSEGEQVNQHDDDSVGYPEDVISLGGDAMVDGVVTYSGNGDGTINLYDVPSHWPASEQIDESMEEYTQDIIDNPEKIEVDLGDDEEVEELINKIDIKD